MNAARLCCIGLFTALQACASDNSGIRVVQRTPEEFCRGSARSIAAERYAMKAKGIPASKAVEADSPPVVIAIAKAVYAGNPRSETAAADLGTSACLDYFRGR